MPEPLCGRARRTDKDYVRKDISVFPGPWRRWCGSCVERLPEGVEPEDVTDEAVKRTGNGSESGTGNVLHVPATALEEVVA